MKLINLFIVSCLLFSAFVSEVRGSNIEKRVAISRQVLLERMVSHSAIPPFLLSQAQCVAAMRNVKAGFIFGGEGSTGMVSCRVNGVWSAPSFLNTGGVSFGLLIGGQVVDNVLLFMTPYSRQMLNRNSLQLGGDLSFAVGPIGDGVGVMLEPLSHVLVYSSGTGLYAGLSLNGTVMTHGENRNQKLYGNFFSADQILSTPGNLAPPSVQPFLEVLNHYAGHGSSH
ncbi:MAG: hypothetical protein EXR74_02850 [Bdellovibrionales bacterium]|nr:hypothetical protein [Bdellovibrionales bacterium]